MARLSEKYGVYLTKDRTWRFQENNDDMYIQKYIGDEWVTKGIFGGESPPTQTPEESDIPFIYAPEISVLYFSDPSVQQDIEGCSVSDEDTISLIMEVTVTNGILDMPMLMPYEEIGGGIRFTGTIEQMNAELSGLKFTPENLTSPARPQDGTINIVLNDQDAGTSNAEHTIIIEVLDDGR